MEFSQDSEIRDRLDRLEALQAIGQLPSRYAMALDARDLDRLVELFVPDVDGGHLGTGRAALKAWFDVALRRFYRSIHHVTGSNFELVNPAHATGSTYCRAEHEIAGGWIVMAMRYDDEFELRDGRWLFLQRHAQPWYAVDVLERPGPEFDRWPGNEQIRAKLPQAFPHWESFWQSSTAEFLSGLTEHP